ncbi:hypothetical protein BDR07DRAFT_1480361 [Suillus spraguei]|nr:hypothetical protein BDR07DRAFT_1480361 [Suillus spraguei]
MPPTHLVQCNSSCWSQPPILPGFRGPSPGNGNVRRHSAPTTSLVKSQATTFVVESTSNLEVPKEPQSIPAAPELLHPKNIENAELNIQGSSLCELIISRIWNGGDGPEVEVFPNVTEEDYDYILNAIGCDDNLVRKPSYIPNLKQLVATLPSPIHEVILVPLHTVMGIIVDSFTIPDDFDISLPIHTAWMIDSPATADLPHSDKNYRLGISDMFLMLQTHNTDILPFWPFKVSVSQSSEAAIAKLQKFSDQNDNVLAITHIHIAEAQKHMLPTYEWAVEQGRSDEGVDMLGRWWIFITLSYMVPPCNGYHFYVDLPS